MISLSGYDPINRNIKYSQSFKGVSDFTQMSPDFNNPDWYAAMQLKENVSQMSSLMPQKFHPILDKFVNIFSVMFSFMIACWSGEKLMDTGRDMVNKVKNKIESSVRGSEPKNETNQPKVNIFDEIKTKIKGWDFWKKHEKLSSNLSSLYSSAKKVFKSSKEFIPFGLGIVAAVTTAISQRMDKKQKNKKIEELQNNTNNYIPDEMINNYLASQTYLNKKLINSMERNN